MLGCVSKTVFLCELKNIIMRLALFISMITLFAACSGEEELAIPKPRTYPKVNYPERKMVTFQKDYCNFSFEHPDYMVFEQDTQFLNTTAKHPCWFNLKMPSLNGEINFTYTDIGGDSLQYNLYEAFKDAYLLAEKHNTKALANEDNTINNPAGKVYGVLFNIEGNVASPFQFTVTDSAQHALRAALYFNSQPNQDSMQPVIEFVKNDIVEILNTFKWNP